MWTAAEGLTLLKANNKTGYFGVAHQPGRPPYKGSGGKDMHLGGKDMHQGHVHFVL